MFKRTKSEVISAIVSELASNGFISIEILDKSRISAIYDGGYNNVYDCKVIINVISCRKLYRAAYLWSFSLYSELTNTTTEFETTDLTTNCGFIDMLIDGHIRDIGNILDAERN